MSENTTPPKTTVPVLVGSKVLPLVPKNLDEQKRMSAMIALSGMAPKSYQGGTIEERTAKICTAIQMGAEIGLYPLQALQSIAVVNGTPTLWGDAMLSVVRSSGLMVYFKEYIEGEWGQDSCAAVCVVRRVGESEEETTEERFTIADAKTAGLWGKGGTWKTHPKRMLKYKARAFALRDKFSDAINGMHMKEEIQPEEMKNITPPQEPTVTPFDRFKGGDDLSPPEDGTPPPVAPQETEVTPPETNPAQEQ